MINFTFKDINRNYVNGNKYLNLNLLTNYLKSILTIANDHYAPFSTRGQCTNQRSNYKTTFFRIETKPRIRPIFEAANYEL